MAQRRRPARTLLGFFIGLPVAYGLVALAGTWTPTLGLDLQGGTRITLIAEDSPSEANLTEAAEIIDQRVNGSGVSEAEVTTQGNEFVVVEIPGQSRRDLVDTVKRQAQLRFRLVACTSVDGRCGTAGQPQQPTTPRPHQRGAGRHPQPRALARGFGEPRQPGARVVRRPGAHGRALRFPDRVAHGLADRGADHPRGRVRRPADLDRQPRPGLGGRVPSLPVPRRRRGRRSWRTTRTSRS